MQCAPGGPHNRTNMADIERGMSVELIDLLTSGGVEGDRYGKDTRLESQVA